VIPRATCIVFDIDDTLYLERDYVRSGFTAVDRWLRTNHGVAGFLEEAWDAFVRGSRGTIFDNVLEELGLERDLVETLVRVYRLHRPAIALLPDARACLDRLRDRVTLAAVSDGPVESQRAKAETLDLLGWLATIVYTAELEPGLGKPHPRAFEIVEERTGCHGTDCVYVADNPSKDFAGPKSLGWGTVRVRRALGLHHGVHSDDDVDLELVDLAGLERTLFFQGAPRL
jgi:putative hydrolase of the HAD superfamily